MTEMLAALLDMYGPLWIVAAFISVVIGLVSGIVIQAMKKDDRAW